MRSGMAPANSSSGKTSSKKFENMKCVSTQSRASLRTGPLSRRGSTDSSPRRIASRYSRVVSFVRAGRRCRACGLGASAACAAGWPLWRCAAPTSAGASGAASRRFGVGPALARAAARRRPGPARARAPGSTCAAGSRHEGTGSIRRTEAPRSTQASASIRSRARRAFAATVGSTVIRLTTCAGDQRLERPHQVRQVDAVHRRAVADRLLEERDRLVGVLVGQPAHQVQLGADRPGDAGRRLRRACG